ncbi:hypothetical protein L9F63_009514, partial [Diploptera punctata]
QKKITKTNYNKYKCFCFPIPSSTVLTSIKIAHSEESFEVEGMIFRKVLSSGTDFPVYYS